MKKKQQKNETETKRMPSSKVNSNCRGYDVVTSLVRIRLRLRQPYNN